MWKKQKIRWLYLVFFDFTNVLTGMLLSEALSKPNTFFD